MPPQSFIMFGSQHLTAIGMVIAASIIFPWSVKRFANPTTEFRIRMLLAAFLWIQEASIWIYRLSNGIFTIQENLPLHLCGFSALLLPILLYTKRPLLYQFLYFWGIGGATQALLTPTLQATYPSYLFIQFFLGHGGIVVAIVYATVIFGYRPTWSGLLKTFYLTASLMIPIGLINWLIGSNYFFISHKPDSASLLDFMGPWPFYLLPLICVGFVIFCITYIPFPIVQLVKKVRSK